MRVRRVLDLDEVRIVAGWRWSECAVSLEHTHRNRCRVRRPRNRDSRARVDGTGPGGVRACGESHIRSPDCRSWASIEEYVHRSAGQADHRHREEDENDLPDPRTANEA